MNFIDRRISWWENAVHYIVSYSMIMFVLEVGVLNTPDTLHGPKFFLWSERVIAVILTIEYFYRIKISGKPWKYIFSPLGVIDFLAILPFYVGFFVHGNGLHIIRSMRVTRLFKLYRYSEAMQDFGEGIASAWPQIKLIIQILIFALLLSSSLEMEIERAAQPSAFGTLWGSMWWSIVTMTTVGYGDEVPVTGWGKIVAIFTMIVGVALMSSLIGIVGGISYKQVKHPSELKAASDTDSVPAG